MAAVLVPLVPSGSAGTPEEPELTDPQGDASTPPTASSGAVDALDVIALWVTEDNETLFSIHWRVAAAMRPGSTDRLEYGASWQAADSRFDVIAWTQQDAEEQGALVNRDGARCAHTATPGTPRAFFHHNVSGSKIIVSIPKSCIFVDTNATLVVLDTFAASTRWCHMEDGPINQNTCYIEGAVDQGTGNGTFVLGSADASMPVRNQPVPRPVRAKAVETSADTPGPEIVGLFVGVASAALVQRWRHTPDKR